jgi:hypothetical protein
MTDFGCLLTAMVTPFNDKLEIDYRKAKKLIEHLIGTGRYSCRMWDNGRTFNFIKRRKINVI